MPEFRSVRFLDANGVGPYHGYTDGTTWNGWANIWAPRATIQKMGKRIIADPTETPRDKLELIQELKGHGYTTITVNGRQHRVVDFSNGYAFTIQQSGKRPIRE